VKPKDQIGVVQIAMDAVRVRDVRTVRRRGRLRFAFEPSADAGAVP
jgi:hypothetical protein